MEIKIITMQSWYDKNKSKFNSQYEIDFIKKHYDEYQRIYNEIRDVKNKKWYIIINEDFEFDETRFSEIVKRIRTKNNIVYCNLDYLDFFRLNKSMVIGFSADDIKNTINYNFNDLVGLQKFISNIFLKKEKKESFFKNNNSECKIIINKRNKVQLYDHNIKVKPKKQLNDNLYMEYKTNIFNVRVASNSESFDIILDKFTSDVCFTYVRFGDADYLMMDTNNIGKTIGHNNKFIVTNRLHKYLIETHNIRDENYLIGSVLSTKLDNKLYSYVSYLNRYRRKIYNFPINYDNLISAVTFPETFCHDIKKYYGFFNIINQKKVMFVGCYFHENLKYLYGENIIHYIKTPKINSYSEINFIYNSIIDKIDDVDVLILSTGQTSRIIANWLWKNGYRKTVIDVGSLSDYAILNTPIEKEINIRLNIKSNRVLIEKSFEKLKKMVDGV